MEAQLKPATRNILLLYPALIFSALCLLIPAYYNHYPLVNSDTGTYISSGFHVVSPDDRPITYGLFIRLFCVHRKSLWFVVFTQSFIVVWLIYRVVKNLSEGNEYIFKSIIVVFLLSVCSSLSWIGSQVQPDIFTSIAYLSIVLVLMGKETKGGNLLLYCLFFMAVAMHFTHPVLMTVSLLFILICHRLYSDKLSRQLVKKLIILLVISITNFVLLQPIVNRSKHVFFVGTLLQKGVLKNYLDDKCATKNYNICAYKDALPKMSDDFLWDYNSALYKMGGWQAVKPEFNAIIGDMFTTPKYVKQYCLATIKQAGEQAVTFNIGDGNQSFSEGDNVYGRISEFLSQEINKFKNSTQNKINMLRSLTEINRAFTVVVVICLLLLFYVLTQWRHLSKEMKLLLVVCISGIVLNIIDCAAFGTVNGRYGCKMIWLIPFCVMAFIATKVKSKDIVIT